MRKKPIIPILLFAALVAGLRAQSSLLFLELQAVGGYSTASSSFELFSLMPEDVMQKPSVGFDLVKRISGKTRDIGVLAVQARLAYSREGAHRLQPQLYNAFFRLKAGFADVWAGHSRPALGLSYVLDSHALLLPAPAMLGYGFDRDWGVGLDRDFRWGSAAASLTAGSGMPLYFKGNFLAAARVSKGVLARDNYSLGLSLAHGKILETMGYTLVEPEPISWSAASVDAAYMWRNLENRAEILLGRRDGAGIVLLFWRSGMALLDEGRLKVEVQPVLMRSAGAWGYSLGSGLTYLLNADLAGRFMVFYDHGRRDARFVVQLYYYKRL
ncbi:MAG: hypothetical protein A2V57_05120 [Candidatus Aminicenantes bacterium RBG_19FT_COMBO_65_30]|nr:MAG: hypothetical protein A2V57_05120 [Candidatus Aminicenantes bacterium RBG_19FT_COMBO_65_30]